MHAKTILTALFLISLGVATMLFLRAMQQNTDAVAAPTKDEILVASVALAPGTLLRTQDVTWQPVDRAAEPSEFVRPPEAARTAKPELDEEARAAVYGAALRGAIGGAAARSAIAAGDPIRRDRIVKPGDRDFLQVVLSPGARAVAIPVATGGASTGLLSPGDRVDVILTQNFRGENAPLTRRSVSETVVEDLRVLAIDALDAKTAAAGSTFGRTVTLEVTPDQAEKINVATELGKLSLILRSVSGRDGLASTASAGLSRMGNVKPTWAGDVSPALSGATPPEKSVAVQPPPVSIIHGSRGEAVKQD